MATTKDRPRTKGNTSTNNSINVSSSKADHRWATRIGFPTDQEITLRRSNNGTTAKFTLKEMAVSEWMPNPDSHRLSSDSGLKETSITRDRCRTVTTTAPEVCVNSEAADENLD